MPTPGPRWRKSKVSLSLFHSSVNKTRFFLAVVLFLNFFLNYDGCIFVGSDSGVLPSESGAEPNEGFDSYFVLWGEENLWGGHDRQGVYADFCVS